MSLRMHERRVHHRRTEKNDGHHGSASGQETMIDGLNDDLAGELQAVLAYVQYAAKVSGSHRHSLREFFKSEVADELRHAQFLADKIAALGGDPTMDPRRVPEAEQPREMLERLLELEERAIADYTERVHQAESANDLGLKVDLESLVADETRHKEEIERILAGWDRASD